MKWKLLNPTRWGLLEYLTINRGRNDATIFSHLYSQQPSKYSPTLMVQSTEETIWTTIRKYYTTKEILHDNITHPQPPPSFPWFMEQAACGHLRYGSMLGRAALELWYLLPLLDMAFDRDHLQLKSYSVPPAASNLYGERDLLKHGNSRIQQRSMEPMQQRCMEWKPPG